MSAVGESRMKTCFSCIERNLFSIKKPANTNTFKFLVNVDKTFRASLADFDR